jgi:hypothetical protein
MKVRYILRICLVLAIAIAGCKKEPEYVPEEPAPKKTTIEQPVREKPVLKEPVREKALIEQSAPEETEADETEYFAVFMEGKKIGHVIQSRVIADGNVITSEIASMTMSRDGVAITMNMTETSIETTDGKPLGFKSIKDMSIMTMIIEGAVDEQGNVNVTTKSIGPEQKSTFEWPSGAVMAEGLRLLHLKHGLKEGTTYTAKIFSPGIQVALEAQIEIGSKQNVDLLGRVVALTEVTTKMNMPGAGEMVSKTYVDKNLRMQKSIMPIAGMHVEMVACAKEFALGENDVLELVDKMFVRSPEPLANLGSAKSITYDLTPTGETSSIIIPSNDNQKVEQLENGKITVTVEPVAAPTGTKFPYKGSDKTILEAIKPTRFLQSDRKEIIDLARRAIGSTNDAAEAVKMIETFVAQYIKNRDMSVGYASALEVANSRQGDCSEFAVLTAAMCRAVGIPAQVVVGVAYVEDFAGHQGFGGHAWTQAYIGGKWVGLDAAFKGTGRGGYDAGHITLAAGSGEPADFLNIATTLGQFKIDKVIISKK